MNVTVGYIVGQIERDGWVIDPRVSEGIYRQFRHRSKPGRITIIGESNDYLTPAAVESILSQAHLGPADVRG